MSVISIVGAQWGDEGKGRIVDYLAQKSDLVIRYQGGDNAGHTVVNDYGKFALHIIPSGIFNDECTSIVGAGCVVNFDTMAHELEAIPEHLQKNLFIDYRAHLIMPFHCLLDGAEEAKKDGHWKVGTTKRGIGPCYSDKASRTGIRAVELLEPEILRARVEMLLPLKNRDLEYYGLKTFTVDEIMQLCDKWRERFGKHIIDTIPVIRAAVEEKKNILLEGQLGVMRDLDWGIYPYSTSSNPTSGGACNTSGISPKSLDDVIGVVKAYSTSVGGGPFVTELFDDDGKKFQNIGNEFGATTGRPRRCGWFDGVALDFSAYINGFTELAITKLDVLDSFPKIKICTAYDIDGDIVSQLPETSLQEKAKPVYEEMDGWMCDTTAVRQWKDLPVNAQKYVKRIEQLAGTPIKYISVGPERDQIIVMK
ncbi:MAG: adenylosuccinate synthase [Sphaerochaetaceae bacterium]|jgi:adenylosuccinate synthase|nr:adenylosuccinate synthase [Sphaerochaetaceae bacterium]MDD3163668.1 adenylosuccinate synthase [Sphaerochaetaceae bacterium]MDD4006614.1 adenylosuccinate synthase [Sphaerochaetaceae bacterium]MDD4397276.1 adenylosuccinate synthase [Sphaerochaetaceae bacterium]